MKWVSKRCFLVPAVFTAPLKEEFNIYFVISFTLITELQSCWLENVLRTEVFKTRSTQKTSALPTQSETKRYLQGSFYAFDVIWTGVRHMRLSWPTAECLCGQKAPFKLCLRDWQPDLSFSISLHFLLKKHMFFPNLEDTEHCSPIQESWTQPSALTALNTTHHTGAL